MNVSDALFLQAILLGLVAIAMGIVVAVTEYYGKARAAAQVIAWVSFVAGLVSMLGAIWTAVAA